jgi:hypothetical protein
MSNYYLHLPSNPVNWGTVETPIVKASRKIKPLTRTELRQLRYEFPEISTRKTAKGTQK